MSEQSSAFDSLGVPYTFDQDLGPLVAARVPGAGDGEWMYDRELHVVASTKTPRPIERISRARAERRAEAAEFIRAWSFEEYAETKRLYMQDMGLSIDDNSQSDENSSEEEAFLTLDQTRAPARRETNASATVSHDHGRASGTHTLADDQWKASCVVTRRARPSNGRIDLSIVTPDGRTFRSWSSARAHVRQLADRT